MKTLLGIQNVTKYYGSGNATCKALDMVSFNVNEGEFVAVMGASGSGKSTLLNMISTIDKVSGGSIILDGNDLTTMKEKELAKFRRDKLGYIFQEYNLLDTLNIRENIGLPLQLQNINYKEADRMVEKMADRFGITEQLDKFPREMSGGQRQRAAAARALIVHPSLILADEPTGALDSANSISLMHTFNMMNKELNASILMVTHDALMGSYATRVLFLKDGKIWNEIYRGDRERKVFYKEIVDAMTVLGGTGDEE
ncbi:MAG TPA: ABC transporter ATP-binding protein [Lachnospiraceae bacterium]|nr:ABC transporter ATP-binding protein [Lachnospiraceae bacterium]